MLMLIGFKLETTLVISSFPIGNLSGVESEGDWMGIILSVSKSAKEQRFLNVTSVCEATLVDKPNFEAKKF